MTNLMTLPDPAGRELTLREHVSQSTRVHPTWHELDHAHYLIAEVGFDGQLVQSSMGDIIQEMIMTRSIM